MLSSKRLFRACKLVAAIVIVLLVAGSVYQYLAERRDLRLNPPPGELVDIGGFRLHLHCVGSGSPTVIIEAGSNDFSVGWTDVQTETARRTQVCTYDRAGAGWSDDDGEIPLPVHVAGNLKALLDSAQVPPPYLLVGHSWGGLLVREFAARFPEAVAGIVLVDSSHENQYLASPERVDELPVGFMRFCHVASVVGMTRALRLRDEPWFDYPEVREMALYRTHSCAATLRMLYASDVSSAQAGPPRDLGEIPLRVFTRGVADSGTELSPEDRAWEDAWLSFQTQLASLSTDSRHQVVAGASHFIHWDRPEVIIETIEELLMAAN